MTATANRGAKPVAGKAIRVRVSIPHLGVPHVVALWHRGNVAEPSGGLEMALYIVEKRFNDVVLLDLRGRLTLGQETADLRARLNQLLEAGQLRIIFKLEGVTYIDSAGLSTLVACHTSARKRDGIVKLTHLTSRVRDLLQITRLSTVFEIFPTVEDARKSFEGAT